MYVIATRRKVNRRFLSIGKFANSFKYEMRNATIFNSIKDAKCTAKIELSVKDRFLITYIFIA